MSLTGQTTGGNYGLPLKILRFLDMTPVASGTA